MVMMMQKEAQVPRATLRLGRGRPLVVLVQVAVLLIMVQPISGARKLQNKAKKSSSLSSAPTRSPALSTFPTEVPTVFPSVLQAPSDEPTETMSASFPPSLKPSQGPIISSEPSLTPFASFAPSVSGAPSCWPTRAPSPSVSPAPSGGPSETPISSSPPSKVPSPTQTTTVVVSYRIAIVDGKVDRLDATAYTGQLKDAMATMVDKMSPLDVPSGARMRFRELTVSVNVTVIVGPVFVNDTSEFQHEVLLLTNCTCVLTRRPQMLFDCSM